MEILDQLSVLAIEQILPSAAEAVGGKGAGAVARFLFGHFTEHQQRWQRALHKAQKQAWQALELALAGNGWWERCQRLVASADARSFRQQIQTFLDSQPLKDLPALDTRQKQEALVQLRAARKAGLLEVQAIDFQAVSNQAGEVALLSEPARQIEARWKTIEQMAERLHQAGYPTLARFLKLRPAAGNPLLVVAVQTFFRRQIESDAELFQSMTWSRLEQISGTQQQGFNALGEALSEQGERLESLLDEVKEVVVETRDAVLDIREELQGQREQIQQLGQNILQLLEQHQLQQRPLRPSDSLSIRGDNERRLVKEVVARYRALSAEQRAELPALLEGVGKLEVMAGDFDAAQKDFQELTTLVTNAPMQAEAHFNAYRAALERRDWPGALQELIKAVKLDNRRFSPFPMGKYQPVRILGAGGFGVAFLCKHRNAGSPLVIKALLQDDLDKDIDDIFREAQILDSLQHPSIIRLRDCDFVDKVNRSRPYLVMDYFEGITLEEYLTQQGPLAEEALVDLAKKVAEALQAAHGKNILHRDVKPANLLVRRTNNTWQVRLIDFGLAHRSRSLARSSKRTQTLYGDSIAGTLDYGSPEQMGRLPGVPVGPQADIYSFAKTCCFALFQTTSPLLKHWKSLSPALAQLLEDCLNENPSERPATFGVVLQRLSGEVELVDLEVIGERKPLGSNKGTRSGEIQRSAERKSRPALKELPEPKPQKTGPNKTILFAGIGGGVVMLLGIVILFFVLFSSRPSTVAQDPPEDIPPREFVSTPTGKENTGKTGSTPVVKPPEVVTLTAFSQLPTWQVKIDDGSLRPVVHPSRSLKIPVPETFSPEDDLLTPSTPSQFVAVGVNNASSDLRELWDLRRPHKMTTLGGPPKNVMGLHGPFALSPDGKMLACSGGVGGRAMRVFDMYTQEEVAKLYPERVRQLVERPTGPILYDFAHPGHLLMVFETGHGHFGLIWELQSKKLVMILTGFTCPSRDAMAFSPGHKQVAFCGDKQLVLFDLVEKKLAGLVELPSDLESPCKGLCFSDDGRHLAGLFGPEGTMKLVRWDMQDGMLKRRYPLAGYRPRTYPKFNSPALAIQWIPGTGNWLLGEHAVLDNETGKLSSINLSEVLIEPRHIRVLDQNRLFFTAGKLKERFLVSAPLLLKDYDLAANPAPVDPRRPGEKTTPRQLKPIQGADLTRLKVLPGAEGAGTWEVKPDAVALPKEPLTGTIQLHSFAPQMLGMVFAGGGSSQVALLSQEVKGSQSLRCDRYDLAGGRHLGTMENLAVIPPGTIVVPQASLSPDGSLLALVDPSNPKRLDLWSSKENKPLLAWQPYDREKTEADRVLWVHMVDNNHLFTVNYFGQLILWKVTDEGKAIPAPQGVYRLDNMNKAPRALSAGHKYLAAFNGETYDIYESLTGQRKGTLSRPKLPGPLTALRSAFNREGTRFAAVFQSSLTTNGEQTLVCWDLTSGAVVTEMRVPRAPGELQWCDTKHILIAGEYLLDLEMKVVVWRFRSEGTARYRPGGPDNRLWYTVSRTPASAAMLQSYPIMDDAVGKKIQAVMNARPTYLKPGTRMSVGMDAGGFGGLRHGKEYSPLLANDFLARVKGEGFNVVPGLPTGFQVNIEEKFRGESLRVPYRDNVSSSIKSVLTWQLTCEVLYMDRKVPLWRQTRTFQMAAPTKEIVAPQNPDQVLYKTMWDEMQNWLTQDLILPSYIVRIGGETVTLPGETVLGGN